MVSFLCYPRVTPLYCKPIAELADPAMDTLQSCGHRHAPRTSPPSRKLTTYPLLASNPNNCTRYSILVI